jgi:membrane fusion protein (multidrug efflux system)
VYHGKVVGFGAGTGAAFSLLPAQNATGNWIKIVQRVPVRVALDAGELAAHPLQIGLSMKADVDVRNGGDGERLPQLANASAGWSTEVIGSGEGLADARVQAIIAANGTGAAAHAAARQSAAAASALLADNPQMLPSAVPARRLAR